VVSSDKGVVVRQSLFLCPYFFSTTHVNILFGNSYYTPSSWSSTHLSCFLYNKRDIYLVQTLTMTWLQNANQYVRIAAGEYVLHIHMFLLQHCTKICLAYPYLSVNIRNHIRVCQSISGAAAQILFSYYRSFHKTLTQIN
jgi:hypothetical protein